MECKTCNQKSKKGGKQNQTMDINLIPESIQNGNYNGNFFFKIIAFLSIVVVLPLIILVLVGQIFMTFFLPKSLPKVSKKFKDFFIGILTSYAKFKHNREVKKRERQFKDTVSYKEKKENKTKTEFDDIEIFENKK